MLFSVSYQFNLLIFSFLAGMVTGILFDFYRVIRGLEEPNKIITFIEDILFWIFTAIVVFIFLLYTSYAYMRGYVYLSIAVGIIVYMGVLSKYMIKAEHNAMKFIGKILRIALNTAIYPLLLVFYRAKRKNKQKIINKNLEQKHNTP